MIGKICIGTLPMMFLFGCPPYANLRGWGKNNDCFRDRTDCEGQIYRVVPSKNKPNSNDYHFLQYN